MTAVQTPPAAVDGVPIGYDVDDPADGDSIDLLRTGRTRIRVADDETGTVREVVLRRPNLLQYRELREKFDEESAADDERRAAAAADDRSFDGTVGMARWTLAVLDKLAPGHELTEDTSPAWFSAPALCPTLLAHWRAVPLARSSAATPTRAT